MNISINFRYVVLGFGLLIMGCHGPVVSTVSETAGVTQTAEPLPDKADSVTEDSINESPEPAWTPEMYAHMAETALGGLVRGAVADAPYQPVMTSWSLNDALYLMRAARYEEARMRASMIRPATSASRFIMAKASILAGLCGPDNPQSGVLLELYKKTDNQDLKPIYQYWLYYAWIDENALDKAANGIDKYHDGDDIDKKYYRQLVLHFAQKVTDNESGDDYEKRLIKWLNKVESNGNGFEASSAIHFRYLLAQKAGRTKEAASLARRLVTGYPATQMALWPQLFEDCKGSLSSNERYHRALRLIKHFDYENARLELIDLVDNKRLTGKTLEDAEWELARIRIILT